MKQNIGTINSMIRITAGLSMLTFLTIRGVQRNNASVHPMMIVMAALKVAEGVVRYCPLTAAFEEMAEETDGIEEGWQQKFPRAKA